MAERLSQYVGAPIGIGELDRNRRGCGLFSQCGHNGMVPFEDDWDRSL